MEPARTLDAVTEVAAPPPAMPIAHDDGIYFDMPEREYHEDAALGSTDMRLLAKSPVDYWYSSWMNPDRPPRKTTPWLELGTAIHVLAFAGLEEFIARYMRGPEQDPDASPAEKRALTKAANKAARAEGRILLPPEHFDRAVITTKRIMANPHLAAAFSGGAAEVSVFWTVERGGLPVRKKARIDYLKARGLGDLKSAANEMEHPFYRACLNAIASYRYDVQARHYMEARAEMPAMIRAGRTSGKKGVPRELLAAIVERGSKFAWQWVFYQSQRAPITWSGVLSPSNPLLEIADGTIAKAEDNFVQYWREYGAAEWLDNMEPGEVFVDELPAYFARE